MLHSAPACTTACAALLPRADSDYSGTTTPPCASPHVGAAPRDAGSACVTCTMSLCAHSCASPALQGGLSPTSSVLVGQLSLAEALPLAGTIPVRSSSGREAAAQQPFLGMGGGGLMTPLMGMLPGLPTGLLPLEVQRCPAAAGRAAGRPGSSHKHIHGIFACEHPRLCGSAHRACPAALCAGTGAKRGNASRLPGVRVPWRRQQQRRGQDAAAADPRQEPRGAAAVSGAPTGMPGSPS